MAGLFSIAALVLRQTSICLSCRCLETGNRFRSWKQMESPSVWLVSSLPTAGGSLTVQRSLAELKSMLLHSRVPEGNGRCQLPAALRPDGGATALKFFTLLPIAI